MERPRRLSYAGLVRPNQQKSRRISDVGQTGIYSPSACLISSCGTNSKSEASETPVAAMIHDSRYDNLNRNSRRTSRTSRDDGFTCSQQSVLSAMDRFVKSVNNMDSTVLVPSRLQDMEVQNENNKFSRLPSSLSNADVYRFYVMLKDVKNELLWGPTIPPPNNAPIIMTSLSSSGRSSPRIMKHVRQPSDDSLGSTGFPSDQETDSDIESVVTDRDSVDEPSSSGTHLASAFRHHLLGLHTILHELADSADFLSTRYQEDIEATL